MVGAFGYPAETALCVGINLAQIGEFAFVLLSVASQLALIPSSVYLLLMGVTALSLLVTPLLLQLSGRFLLPRVRSAAALASLAGGGGSGAADVEMAAPLVSAAWAVAYSAACSCRVCRCCECRGGEVTAAGGCGAALAALQTRLPGGGGASQARQTDAACRRARPAGRTPAAGQPWAPHHRATGITTPCLRGAAAAGGAAAAEWQRQQQRRRRRRAAEGGQDEPAALAQRHGADAAAAGAGGPGSAGGQLQQPARVPPRPLTPCVAAGRRAEPGSNASQHGRRSWLPRRPDLTVTCRDSAPSHM